MKKTVNYCNFVHRHCRHTPLELDSRFIVIDYTRAAYELIALLLSSNLSLNSIRPLLKLHRLSTNMYHVLTQVLMHIFLSISFFGTYRHF